MIECPVCRYRWNARDVRHCPDCGESIVVADREECSDCGAGMRVVTIRGDVESDEGVLLVCSACWESPLAEENRRA